MPTVDQPGVRKVVPDPARAIRCPGIQQFLDALPTIATHQRFVNSRVRGTVPVEIARIQALPQDLVDKAAVEPATAELNAFHVQFFHQRLDE